MRNPTEFSQEMRSRKLWFGVFIFCVCAALVFFGKISDSVFGNVAEACLYAYALANVGDKVAANFSKNNKDTSAG